VESVWAAALKIPLRKRTKVLVIERKRVETLTRFFFKSLLKRSVERVVKPGPETFQKSYLKKIWGVDEDIPGS